MTFIYVPLEASRVISSGEVIAHSYWSVHPERGLAFYHHRTVMKHLDDLSPQCNRNERITKMLASKMLPECEVVYIEAVYMGSVARWLADASKTKDGNSLLI